MSSLKKGAVLKVLKRCAADMRTMTYRDIAIASESPSYVAIGPQLAHILHVCRRRGLPWLSALAVDQNTMRPSKWMFAWTDVKAPPKKATYKKWWHENEYELWWRGMLLQIYALDWSSFEIDETPHEP